MKILAALLIVVSGLLSGCIVAEPQNRGEHRGEYRSDRDRDGVPDRADRDRDGDGVANRQDRRPDDPRRY
jgi:hypothetical protein